MQKKNAVEFLFNLIYYVYTYFHFISPNYGVTYKNKNVQINN